MKKIKRFLCVAMFVTLSFATLCFSAACAEKKASYTFMSDGVTYDTQKIAEGTEYTLPIPEKEGYKFLGWYQSENFEGEAITSIIAEKDGGVYYAKWEKLCAITLVDAESLGTNKLYLKEGENISQFMQAYVPEKTGLMFGAWFVNGAELSRSEKITSDGITLEARYKVQYTAQLYVEDLETGKYVKLEEDVTGYDYLGKTLKSQQSLMGFTENEAGDLPEGSPQRVTELTLTEDITKNVFTHYFDRETYTVKFRSNYPDDREELVVSVDKKYEEALTVLSDFEMPGYCLMGWSTSANGEVEYAADYIATVLFGVEKESASEEFVVKEDETLYAVWQQGNVDFFGSSEDYIFLLSEDSDTIYLSRGGIYFSGEYYQDDRSFCFFIEDMPVIEGILNENGTYIYYDSSRKMDKSLYEFGVGVNDNVKIHFDSYNGVDYEVTGEGGSDSISKGTYFIDERGYYIASFTEGELKDNQMTFIVGSVTISGVAVDVFQVLQEDEVALGTLPRFAVGNGGLSVSTQTLTLNGLGMAAYYNGSSTTYYYYLYDSDAKTITLIDRSTGRQQGVMKLVTEGEQLGFASYNAAAEREFPFESGAKLICDGIYNGTYTDGETTLNGYYTLTSSEFGVVATLYVGEQTYKYMITSKVVTVPDESEGAEEGATVEEIAYTAVEIYNGYAEYFFRNGEGKTEDAPLMIINGKDTATLYGYNKTTRTYVVVSTGRFVYDETLKLYVYTAENIVKDADVSTDFIDVKDVSSFVCDLGAVSGNSGTVAVYYWYSSTDGEGKPTDYDTGYTQKDGDAKLTLVAGIAIYSTDAGALMGSYAIRTYNGVDVLVISTSQGYMYVELVGDTFIVYSTAPYQAYILQENGSTNEYEYVLFDGKGGATYVVITVDENGNELSRKEYVGTFTDTQKKTEFDVEIYAFSGETEAKETISFEYLSLSTSSQALIAPYNTAYNGEYTSEDGGYLTLDGFGFQASYWSPMEDFEGRYWIVAENVVCFVTEDGYRYFDLKDRAFTMKGEEYGVYLIKENQSFKADNFVLDGYGKVTVYIYDETAEKGYVTVEGSYVKNGNQCVVTYSFNSEEITVKGVLGTYSSTYGLFTVVHEEVVKTYVNEEDWSLLVLDNAGNAVKYEKNGKKETGMFILITEDLLYYVNSAATDASLYKYGTNAKGEATATPITLTARGYFSADLQSLLFSKYGFVLKNGEVEYYYEYVNSEIVLYYKDEENPAKNRYGFVEKIFGQPDAEVILDSVKYFANDGVRITFNRDADTKDLYPAVLKTNDATKYPLQALSFTPVGDETYTVEGKVKIDGSEKDCYVVRSLDENGEVIMNVVYGTYIYDIKINYTGDNDNSVYEIVGLRSSVTCYSYVYLYLYEMLAPFGIPVNNTYGMIQLHTEYDLNGNEGRSYLLGVFGESSKMYDLNGKLVSITDSSTLTLRDDGIYVAEFVAEDGYTYHFYFVMQYYSTFGVYSYNVYALAREEVLTTADNTYEVTMDVVVATEHSLITVGDVIDLSIKSSETKIDGGECIYVGDDLYYIVRTTGEDAKTTYYKIVLNKSEVNEKDPTVTYKDVAVTVIETVTTTYSEDGVSYVDVLDGKVTVFCFEGTLYAADVCEYDSESGVYTVVTNTDKTFTIKISNGDVTIEEVQQTADNEDLETAA